MSRKPSMQELYDKHKDTAISKFYEEGAQAMVDSMCTKIQQRLDKDSMTITNISTSGYVQEVKPINAFEDILDRKGDRLILLGILEELTNIRKILAKANKPKRKKK